MVDKSELDTRHAERVNDALTRIRAGEDDAFESLVLSERVFRELDDENIVLHSFNVDVIKSYLPYSDRIYVMICPQCVTVQNIDSYKALVETSSIVPIFGGSYSNYDDKVVDITYSHNHVGGHEYFALRSLFAGAGGHAKICSHCVKERASSITAQLGKRRLKGFVERDVRAMMTNLHPYVKPDFELLDELESALAIKDIEKARSLFAMSWMLSHMRSASIFNSPIIVSGESYAKLPIGYDDHKDQTQQHAIKIQKSIGEGLGIQLPEGLSLSKYIEIASDFRPRIQKLTSELNKPQASDVWQSSLDKEIMGLNQEAARAAKSSKYIALAAMVEFYSNNHIKLNSALFAASMSLGAGALGCGVAAVAGTAGGAAITSALTGIAGAKGWISSGPALERAGRTVNNVVQPQVDALIAKYVGTTPMALSVISLKKDIKATA